MYGLPSRYSAKSQASRKTTLQCNFCGTIFQRVIGPRTYEIRCPKCKEIDVEIVSNPSEEEEFEEEMENKYPEIRNFFSGATTRPELNGLKRKAFKKIDSGEWKHGVVEYFWKKKRDSLPEMYSHMITAKEASQHIREHYKFRRSNPVAGKTTAIEKVGKGISGFSILSMLALIGLIIWADRKFGQK